MVQRSGLSSEATPNCNVIRRRETSIAELNCGQGGHPGGLSRALSIVGAGAKRK